MFGPIFLIALRTCLLLVEFTSLRDLALASSLRTFWRSSTVAPLALSRVNARWSHDDSPLCPARRSFVDAWVASSVSLHLGSSVDAVAERVAIPISLAFDRPPTLQAQLSRLLRSERFFFIIAPDLG